MEDGYGVEVRVKFAKGESKSEMGVKRERKGVL